MKTVNLDVIDESGAIIGQESRKKIHKDGLLHREIHVWLYTPAGEIIFQHRAKDKDTAPDLLDASVGGHVEIGMGWEDSAIKELEEEAGIVASPVELVYLSKIRSGLLAANSNNALRHEYAYRYTGNIKDLRVEQGKSFGFEAWHIRDLLNVSETDRSRFIPLMLSEQYLAIYRQIETLL